MAGVLERMKRSRKQLLKQSLPLDAVRPEVIELQTAKEILAETFGISVQQVEEMLQLRCQEQELWPERFTVY